MNISTPRLWLAAAFMPFCLICLTFLLNTFALKLVKASAVNAGESLQLSFYPHFSRSSVMTFMQLILKKQSE
jgi:hypothetical protein